MSAPLVEVTSGTCFECSTPNPDDFTLYVEGAPRPDGSWEYSHWYCGHCGSTDVRVCLSDGRVIRQEGLS
jgi:hypothetical protein